MSETRTITVGQGVGDALAHANKVADALRADGKVVTIGTEYDDVSVKKYGMRSVDITIDDPVEAAQSSSAPETATTAGDATTVVVAEPTPTDTVVSAGEPGAMAMVPAEPAYMTDAELDAQLAKDAASTADEIAEGDEPVTDETATPAPTEPAATEVTEDNALGNDAPTADQQAAADAAEVAADVAPPLPSDETAPPPSAAGA